MSSSEASAMAPARRGASGPASGASLAGLIGVLDRADGAAPTRTRPVHSGAFRASVRAVPLRSVQLAPSARSARLPAAPPRIPTVTVVPDPDPERRPVTGLRDLTRRIALWGGGAHGEYLAWRTPEPAPTRPLRPRLRALTRRIALWGAGPDGEHLAWGRPTPVPAPRQVDPPVVLRELPSTPTIRPAAPSPAVALLPAPMGPVRPGWAPPPPGWPQPPAWGTSAPARAATIRPAAPRRPLAATVVAPVPSGPGRTVPAARSPSAEARAGPARARGDPSSRSDPAPLEHAATAPS